MSFVRFLLSSCRHLYFKPVNCFCILLCISAVIYAEDNNGTVSQQSVSAEQVKGWLLGCSGVVWQRNYDRFDTLAGKPVTRAYSVKKKELLSEWWGIENKEDFYESLSWIDNGGHRDNFIKDVRKVGAMDPNQFGTFLGQCKKEEPRKLNDYYIAWQYHDEVGDANLMGWDYCRYICLCRWAYQCGYIDEQTAWKLIIPAGMKMQKTFNSWEQMGRNYLIGRQYWSYQQTKGGGYRYEDAYLQLCQMPSSPWNKYAWDLDLSNAYEIIMNDIKKNPALGPIEESSKTIDDSKYPSLEFSELMSITNELADLKEQGPVRIVPDEYETIQLAIDAAKEGDTVFVKAGIYKERLELIEEKNLRVVGQSRDKVIICCPDTNARDGIRFYKADNVKISDLTFKGYVNKGDENKHCNICVSEGEIEILRCRINSRHCGVAMNFFGAAKATVRDSIIESYSYHGFYILDEKTRVAIENCRIVGKGNQGVFVTKKGSVTVNQTLVENNRRQGIAIMGKGSRLVCSNSQIRKNLFEGLGVQDGAEAVVQNCRVNRNGKYGIWVSGKDTDVALENIRSSENKSYGFYIGQNAQAKIENCLSDGNGEGGIIIYQQAAEAIVSNTKCLNNTSCGIWFCDNANGSVKGCCFENNSTTGISITSGSVCQIESNMSVNNKITGIVIKDSEVHLIENIVEKNGESGVYIGGESAEGVFTKNRFSKNGCVGMEISDGAKVTVSENLCKNNTREGILVSGDAPPTAYVIGNRCINNYPTGIVFQNGAKGCARDNICQQNPWVGIAVRGEKTSPVIEGNNCSQNGTWGIAVWSDAAPSWGAPNMTKDNGKDGIMVR